MSRSILNTSLPKTIINRLRENGCLYYEDLERSKVPWIKEVFDKVQRDVITFKISSALDILKAETENDHISTMSESLDRAIDNGLPLGSVVEVFGLPGNGKTQLCLQLCVCVQIPSEFGGLEGEAVYIDTNSNFRTSRLQEIADGCRKKLFNAYPKSRWDSKVLHGVHYMETFGASQFCASIILLEKFLEEKVNIKLVVIDNISFPFKIEGHGSHHMGILCRILSKLHKLAAEKNIAIVITNEMTTRMGIGTVAALGDIWAHYSGTRISLSLPKAIVTHNSKSSDSTVMIQITEDGIGDLE